MPWQRPAPRDRVLFAQTKGDQRWPKVADGHTDGHTDSHTSHTWPKLGISYSYLGTFDANHCIDCTDIHRQNMAKSCLGEVAVFPRANELVSARMAQAAGRWIHGQLPKLHQQYRSDTTTAGWKDLGWPETMWRSINAYAGDWYLKNILLTHSRINGKFGPIMSRDSHATDRDSFHKPCWYLLIKGFLSATIFKHLPVFFPKLWDALVFFLHFGHEVRWWANHCVAPTSRGWRAFWNNEKWSWRKMLGEQSSQCILNNFATFCFRRDAWFTLCILCWYPMEDSWQYCSSSHWDTERCELLVLRTLLPPGIGITGRRWQSSWGWFLSKHLIYSSFTNWTCNSSPC